MAVNSHHRGSASEMLVASDLLLNGFEVFTPVATGSTCDLIAYDFKKRKMFRVEVKTGKVKATVSQRFRETYDVLANVLNEKIYYSGAMDFPSVGGF